MSDSLFPIYNRLTVIDQSRFPGLTAHYHTFGCKLNFAETSTVARTLAEKGIMRVQRGDVPDFVIINTCSVTELADKKCRQAIRKFARQWPEAKIVVTGCYAQLRPDRVASLPGVAIVAGTDRKGEIDCLIEEYLEQSAVTPLSEKNIAVTPTKDIRIFTPSCSQGDRTRCFLKVQDGCDYFCSYCTIPYARGRSRSGTIAEMVTQAGQAAANGAREIVITGVNIGDFGRRNNETFLDLICALDDVEGIDRYRISSIEPNLLTDEIIEFVASSHRFMPHFHVPLQCGDDEVLKLMRRHYDTALFRHRMEKIVQLIPDAFIGVDLIVGARGESAERYENSRRFVESLPISRLHVFPYSERPGTRALEIEGNVDPAERHRRALEMIALSERKLEEFAGRYDGTVRNVLFEHTRRRSSTPGGGDTMTGHTDNYLQVEVPYNAALANTIQPVRLTLSQSPALSSDGLITGRIILEQ